MSTVDPRRRPAAAASTPTSSAPSTPIPSTSAAEPIPSPEKEMEDVDAEGEDDEPDVVPMDDASSSSIDLDSSTVPVGSSSVSDSVVAVASEGDAATLPLAAASVEETSEPKASTAPFSFPGAPQPEEVPAEIVVEPARAASPSAVTNSTETDAAQAARDSAMDAAIAATLALLPPEDDEPADASTPTVSHPAPEPSSSVDSPMNELSPSTSSQLPRSSRFSDAPFIAPPVDMNLLDAGRQAALAFAARTAGTAKTRVAQLQARVEKDPLDGEAQLALVKDAEEKGDLERSRKVYEEFLKVFPDATQQWIAYASLELSHSEFGNAEDIFARCMKSSPTVEIAKFYLDYIRRMNAIDPNDVERAKQTRALIAKSFEYALGHVGQDRKAGDLWMEYIGFLKEGPNRGTWEDQQRMDALRKAYQRAVCIPLNNVELIWQEYNQFENNLNKMTAKKFVAELSPSYMTARKALRELRAQFDHLPTPLLPHRPEWRSRGDREALELWKKYLAWEEANPLDLEDPQALAVRVSFAYKKATANLRFFSEIWHVAATYNVKLGKVDDARALLRSGLAAIPSSLLLGYTLVDLEERLQDYSACHKVYESLIETFHSEIGALEEATQKELTSAMEAFDKQIESEGTANGDDAEGREKTNNEREEIKKTIEGKNASEIDVAKKGAANVWIAEMRFARRAEGIKQARATFTKARKSKYMVWQVVEASAKMELYWNNDSKVATNVFELGLKTFSTDPEYVLQYLDFLIQTNNPNNARALFERTAALVEPAKAKAIWDRMALFEYQYGDFLAAQKIFTRYSEAFPDASMNDRFAQRYGYLGLDEALIQDIGLLPSSSSSDADDDRRSRSPSPRRAPGKRQLSLERGAYDRPGSIDRPGFNNGPPQNNPSDYGQKRLRPNHPLEPSPAPSSNDGGGGRAWDRGRIPHPRDEPMEDHDFRRRRAFDNPPPPIAPPNINRPVPFMLDPRGDHVAVLPEAVVFFLSILPPAHLFNGPKLDSATIVDVIGNTLLPGTAPGPGLPGERLGIPPRPKPNQGYDRAESPRRGGGGREPDYGRDRGRNSGGGGRRY